VAATARSALGDTRRFVGLLRDPDAGVPGPALPGLEDVPALVKRVRESGLPVSLQMAETLPPLPGAVAATAYRIVQESLTNVVRHAGQVHTLVGVTFDHGNVTIEVRNQPGDDSVDPHEHGHGLVGMRERVLECGGQLTSEADEQGGFSVTAVLPATIP